MEQRTLTKLEIDIVIAVGVPEFGAASMCEIQWHRLLHFADTTVYAASDRSLGACEQILGNLEGIGHVGIVTSARRHSFAALRLTGKTVTAGAGSDGGLDQSTGIW